MYRARTASQRRIAAAFVKWGIPTAQAILFARYPREEHGTAAAFFGLGAVTGPLLGPTIGGYLIEWSS